MSNFDNLPEYNKNKNNTKKNKKHQHRKHYDYNDDFQKNKQYKIKKQNLIERYYDNIEEEEDK